MSGGTSTPHAGRFAKGASGNPKGRPRNAKATTVSAFDIVIDRTLTVIQNGRSREITVDEALQQKAYHEAIAGSRMAQRAVMKMVEKRDAASTAKHPPKVSYEVLIEQDCDSANAALVVLGIARATEISGAPRLKLETWAIQAALDRRKRAGFTTKELDEARRNALETKAVRWPEAVTE